jgi:hypothetical protein
MPIRRIIVLAALAATAAHLNAQGARLASPEQASADRVADSVFAAKDYKQAARLYARLTQLDSAAPRYWSQLGMSAALTNDFVTGARAFERASTLHGGPAASYNAGAMFARLGQSDSAFAWLRRAVQGGFFDTTTLLHDTDVESLRGDARFAAIVHDASVAPAPCRDDPNFHRFDFWVGNWRVTTAGGQPVGTSHVDVVSGGCALLENWRDLRGGEGKSLNTFDANVGGWRQFWVGQGGTVTDYNHSEWRGASLVFLSHGRLPNGGGEIVSRLTFTPLDSGVVRQFGEVSLDGGKTWPSSYDFRYHPLK